MEQDQGLGPLYGFWFIVRAMLTIGGAAWLVVCIPAHYSAGTWEVGFMQGAAWAGMAYALNGDWRHLGLRLGALAVAATGLFRWFTP